MTHAALDGVLGGLPRLAIAVSGGVDSMTLAHAAHRIGLPDISVVHALSPAVPAEASARVREHAARFGWRLREVDAGEFADPSYRANPVNRCYFCKTNLYARIALVVTGPIASGANLDDLGDYRPGLTAAAEHGVRHPFVEAGMDKAAVRALARDVRAGRCGGAAGAALPVEPGGDGDRDYRRGPGVCRAHGTAADAACAGGDRSALPGDAWRYRGGGRRGDCGGRAGCGAGAVRDGAPGVPRCASVSARGCLPA